MKGSLASMLCRPVYRVLLRNVSFGRIDEKVPTYFRYECKGQNDLFVGKNRDEERYSC